MKRLAAIAILVGLSFLPLDAQRGGGSHGGFSGPHGGFSGSHAGFSGSHSGPAFQGGFSGRAGPSVPRFSGFRGTAPGRYSGPPHSVPSRMPFVNRGLGPGGQRFAGPRSPNPDPMHHRMPYHSPYGRDHSGRDHHDRDHHRFGLNGAYGWSVSLWPGWGWGYPYLPSYWGSPDDYDSYDSQSTANYSASQPYPDTSSGPYEPAPEETEPEQPAYTPWPYSQPAPSTSRSPVPPPVAETPVTLVFKDGRPNEQIHNYLLMANTLSVLDRGHRDIPLDQIDLSATAKANREAGVDFALPGSSQ